MCQLVGVCPQDDTFAVVTGVDIKIYRACLRVVPAVGSLVALLESAEFFSVRQGRRSRRVDRFGYIVYIYFGEAVGFAKTFVVIGVVFKSVAFSLFLIHFTEANIWFMLYIAIIPVKKGRGSLI